MEKLEKENESLFIAAQNNGTWNNDIKVEIDNMHQNSKCRSCDIPCDNYSYEKNAQQISI